MRRTHGSIHACFPVQEQDQCVRSQERGNSWVGSSSGSGTLSIMSVSGPAERSKRCSVWLGAETGILKGVSVAHRQAFNFCNSSHLSRDQELRVLAWGDPQESELLLGSVDGTVRTFSLEKGAFTAWRSCGDAQEGCFTGLAPRPGGALLTCTEQGKLCVWSEEGSEPVSELSAGTNVCRMRASPVHAQRAATGGKENGLKIWDLQKPQEPVFSAKNLRDDWLDLRRPYWVKDLHFIPQSQRVVTCTAYHQVHVFDPSSPQRRPVLEAEFGEFPLTSLALPAGGDTVVVGNTQGQLAMLDLRMGRVRGVLKGATGSIRALQCHAQLPLVASCGLDRFLRIHHLEDRHLKHKVYLKSRLNCLLLSSSLLLEEDAGAEAPEEVKEEKDEVWDAMEQLQDEEEEEEEEEEGTKTKPGEEQEERKPDEEKQEEDGEERKPAEEKRTKRKPGEKQGNEERTIKKKKKKKKGGE